MQLLLQNELSQYLHKNFLRQEKENKNKNYSKLMQHCSREQSGNAVAVSVGNEIVRPEI